MTQGNEEQSYDERRSMPRYPSRAAACLYRETDAMRIGITGQLIDISVDGLGVRVDTELQAGEEVRIQLSNPTQRFAKEVRGIVRHSDAEGAGKFLIGVELRTRFTPPEVQMLRSNRPPDTDEDKPRWV